MKDLINKLDVSAPLRDPVVRRVIRRLELPEGSEGLDAGCGIGSHTALLAEAVGPGGHVTGLDLSEELLSHAEEVASRSGCGDRVSFRQGNVNGLPFNDECFDWAWSVDCVGHVSIGNPQDGLRELARVVRPGGRLVILSYTAQLLLPGFPQLEARLNATASAVTSLGEGRAPEENFMRALGWFDAVGLVETAARTVVGTVRTPLDDRTRSAVLSLITMLWGDGLSKMTETDQEEFRRLTAPASPNFILDCSDYCGFFTYSVFEGRVAHRE